MTDGRRHVTHVLWRYKASSQRRARGALAEWSPPASSEYLKPPDVRSLGRVEQGIEFDLTMVLLLPLPALSPSYNTHVTLTFVHSYDFVNFALYGSCAALTRCAHLCRGIRCGDSGEERQRSREQVTLTLNDAESPAPLLPVPPPRPPQGTLHLPRDTHHVTTIDNDNDVVTIEMTSLLWSLPRRWVCNGGGQWRSLAASWSRGRARRARRSEWRHTGVGVWGRAHCWRPAGVTVLLLPSPLSCTRPQSRFVCTSRSRS